MAMMFRPLLVLLLPSLFVAILATKDRFSEDGGLDINIGPIGLRTGFRPELNKELTKERIVEKRERREMLINKDEDAVEDIVNDRVNTDKAVQENNEPAINDGNVKPINEPAINDGNVKPINEPAINDGNVKPINEPAINDGNVKPIVGGEPGIAAPLDEIPSPELETKFLGAWRIHSPNSGVCAMQMQLMPNNNKAVWFDNTELGPSVLPFNPPFCQPSKKNPNVMDCFAHAVEYDIISGNVKPLKMQYDPWCSSGSPSPNGALVSTGGDNAGFRAVRILNNCNNCEFQEKPAAMGSNRWYATNQILPDGRIAVVGGRAQHNYEVISSTDLNFPIKHHPLPLLQETQDEVENNLFPFVYLLPNGYLFIFANTKSVIINPESGETIRKLPDLPGNSRNYPASGMSAMLPLKLTPSSNDENVVVEVLVCGGNKKDAFKVADVEPRVFFNAENDCGRINVNDKDAQWEKEVMPSARVMGDMLLLPTGDILMLNGAKKGTSGWFCADEPNFVPVLYSPDKQKGQRFKELQATNIARMYHSASVVLPDGEILVAGSNTNPNYNFQAKFPTELRVEKFTPPYLAPELQMYRPEIIENQSDKALIYGKEFRVHIKLGGDVKRADIKVTMLPPPFTTHGFSQGQRLIVLGLTEVKNDLITAMAPPSAKMAPPGYYMLFVVHRGVPSKAMWVKI